MLSKANNFALPSGVLKYGVEQDFSRLNNYINDLIEELDIMQQNQPVKASILSRIISVFNHPGVIKFCLYGVIIAWAFALGGGYLFAQLNPGGYSLLRNYISDLGSLHYTPLPNFLNNGLMLTGTFMVPTALYLRRFLSPAGDTNWFRKIFSYIILCVYMVGSIGIFLTGVISEDVGAKWDALFGMPFPNYAWHDFVSDLAFYSFIGNGFLIFLLLEIFPSILEKHMGVTRKRSIIIRVLLGIDVFIICPVFFAIFWTSYPDMIVFGMFSSFWEWCLVLSYTAWQIPLVLLLINTQRKIHQNMAAGS